MSFNVRIFGHRGTRQLQQLVPTQFTSAISESLVQPYDWMQIITTNGASPVSSILVGPSLWGFTDNATVLVLEVPNSQIIRCEFNTPTRTGSYATNGVVTAFTVGVAAGNNSSMFTGKNVFAWTPGTTLSIVEQSFYL